MITKPFINLRTLSLVFVMVAALMVGGVMFAQPAQAQMADSYSSEPTREELMAQVQQLMAILMQLLVQMESQQPTEPSVKTVVPETKQEYEFSPIDRQVRPGNEFRVGQLHAPDTGDEHRYLDYLAVSVIPEGNEKPWETFDSITLGIPVHELTFDMSRPEAWKNVLIVDYGWGYKMEIFSSRSRGYGVKLPGDYQDVNIKLATTDDAEPGDWEILFSAQAWSESTGHTALYGGDVNAEFAITGSLTDNTPDRDDSDRDDDSEDDDFWEVDSRLHIVGAGAYEGVNSSLTTVTGGNRPGTIDVELPAGALYEDTMLVLTAYEPVTWNVIGDGADDVSKVFLSGYYDQDVIGIDASVPVVEQTYEGGDREYFYFYQADQNLDKLIDYLEDKTGVRPYNFESEYKPDSLQISWKG
jgi:hypothetical protein